MISFIKIGIWDFFFRACVGEMLPAMVPASSHHYTALVRIYCVTSSVLKLTLSILAGAGTSTHN